MENPRYHKAWQAAIDSVPKTDEVNKILQEAEDDHNREMAAGIYGSSLVKKQYYALLHAGYIDRTGD